MVISPNTWPHSGPEFPDTLLSGFKSDKFSANVTVSDKQSDIDIDLLDRYSSYDKLVNVTGFTLRFIHNCRNPNSRKLDKSLSVIERRNAVTLLIRKVQESSFEEEIDALKANLKIKSALKKLDLFLDTNNLIRVGGRIKHSDLPYNAKHPILLPGKGTLVKLLVEHFHKTYCHVGAYSLEAILSRNYWILSARRLTRSVTFKCVQCYKTRPHLVQPFMSDLPRDRVRELRPFQSVGTDFAGPFHIKSSSLRNARIEKCYLCVFVCLVTKAVHLEVVSGLSIEAFVDTFTRFVSRRGLPSLVRSDCGTNFTGTDKYLKDLYVYIRDNSSDISRELAKSNITWLFNPPSSPNMGGLFEAAVKTAKMHMLRVLGEQKLTFEQLTTFFTRVEAVMNSRPLTPLSSDPNDQEVLTPGHFLIGEPLVSLPEYNYDEVKVGTLNRFQLLQRLSQHFWIRWRNEYLHTLQLRCKWNDHTTSPKVNDLVLIKEDNCPPLEWKRGRIISLMPGKDGIVRVVKVRTQKNVLIRPVSKLSILPLDD